MSDPHEPLPFPARTTFPSRSGSGELPADRLLRAGGGALSDAELLGLLLPRSSTHVASRLLERFEGLLGVARADGRALSDLEPSDRAALLAAFELARRLGRSAVDPGELLNDPVAVSAYLGLRYGEGAEEVLGGLFLDVRNRLIAEIEVHRGTSSRTKIGPQAIFKEALLHSAWGILFFHIRPSVKPSPRSQDLAFARTVAAAGELVGIRVVDYVLLGNAGRWVSLNRRGVF